MCLACNPPLRPPRQVGLMQNGRVRSAVFFRDEHSRRNREAAAKRAAELLGDEWGPLETLHVPLDSEGWPENSRPWKTAKKGLA